ncbi:N-acetylmuramoyl-L-alanine amidase [Neobacillus sp.]|uniref:N-acetylmuramoyl-L-alanine amidase n=1 Tax=Neobacillus sp. TaxID=2675273 RepID=UPI0028A14F6B|nr:N-acetylmuramoyl-L-alanine amidase [Neobacillus sp.]
MNIIQRLIPVSNNDTRPGLKLVPKFITIHETDNTSAGADAEAHARLQQRGNDRTASWHLQIDDHEILQSIPFDEVAWAAGDGRNGPGNRTSIHIEMCVNTDGDYEKTVSNTVEVVQYLMSRYIIPIDHIVPHKHWTSKNCPQNLLLRWSSFIKSCQSTNNGWVKKDAQWFFYKNGRKQTGWVKVKNKWYFLDVNGVMQTGWVKDESKWYFLDNNGVMKTGWVKDESKWYFLDNNGVMKTGWVEVNNKWYNFGKDGAMVTGWIKYKSKWYFLKSNGEMAIGWLKDNDKWYYLDPDGSMLSGQQTISGKEYTFGKDGALIEAAAPPAGGNKSGSVDGKTPASDNTGGDTTPAVGENLGGDEISPIIHNTIDSDPIPFAGENAPLNSDEITHSSQIKKQ